MPDGLDGKHDRAAAFASSKYPQQQLTREIIAACFRVHSTLGYGFLESVYRRAMAIELTHRAVSAFQEVPFQLSYRGVPIGEYRADLVVEASVVVEVKTGLVLDPVAVPQVLNYLRAARLSVGLILHFGPRAKIKRVIATRTPAVDDLS